MARQNKYDKQIIKKKSLVKKKENKIVSFTDRSGSANPLKVSGPLLLLMPFMVENQGCF